MADVMLVSQNDHRTSSLSFITYLVVPFLWTTVHEICVSIQNCQAKNFVERLRTKLNRAVNLDMHAECAEEDLSEVNILRGVSDVVRRLGFSGPYFSFL